jgi:hypothetical protein
MQQITGRLLKPSVLPNAYESAGLAAVLLHFPTNLGSWEHTCTAG